LEKPKLNGELKSKLEALREELHTDHTQAVDEARRLHLEVLQAHREEVKALAEKRQAEFKSLQQDFQKKQSTLIHPDSAK